MKRAACWLSLLFVACNPPAPTAPIAPIPSAAPAVATGTASATVAEEASEPAAPPPACGPAQGEPPLDPVSGLRPVWRVETGGGAYAIDVSRGMVVHRIQGGRSVSYDAETGATCAVLVDGARGGPIDPYSTHSFVIHGTLVGPSGTKVSAVDLRTGAVLWSREVAGSQDEYALRDGLLAVEAGKLDALAFRVRRRDGDLWRFDETVAGVDPRTGEERWRKIVVAHPHVVSLPAEGTLRLAGSADAVFVRSNGKLTALSAATGDEIWSVTWPWTPPAPGPRTPEKLGPLVAAGGGRVAIAHPGRIDVYDGRTGARVAQALLPGEVATEIAVTRAAVYAALERAPGKASVVAADAATGATIWTHAAAYAVRRVRVDADLVYVAEGDGRAWALDAHLGTPRFGVTSGAFDVAAARSLAGAPRMIVPAGALAAFDPPAGSRPRSLAPFLRWEIEARTGTVREGCYARAFSWVDGDERVVWEKPVPPRVGTLFFGACDEPEVTFYAGAPRMGPPHVYTVLGVQATDDAVVEADLTGVLAMAKADGRPLLDVDAPIAGDALFFDAGSFRLDGKPRCEGPSARAHVFARCGDRFVYFNGTTAALIATSPWRVEARATYPQDARTSPRDRGAEASIRLGKHTLTLRGVTYGD
jgi:outer membrane protein assembly factor BamB